MMSLPMITIKMKNINPNKYFFQPTVTFGVEKCYQTGKALCNFDKVVNSVSAFCVPCFKDPQLESCDRIFMCFSKALGRPFSDMESTITGSVIQWAEN